MYQLPKLSYLFQDFEPYIDTHTMGLHYYKHQQNYLNQLNTLLVKNNYNYQYSLEELLFHINDFPVASREDILFNLGGVLNHNLYWKSISPRLAEKPSGKLKGQIETTFGNYEKFFEVFKGKAMQLKGAGYTFLVLKSTGQLDIVNTSNQDTPLLVGDIPLLNVDLWEHAYYLNYENDKMKYLDNFGQIVDFAYANKIFNSIMK